MFLCFNQRTTDLIRSNKLWSMFHFSLLFENSIKNVSKTKQKSFLSTKILGKNDYGRISLDIWEQFCFCWIFNDSKKVQKCCKIGFWIFETTNAILGAWPICSTKYCRIKNKNTNSIKVLSVSQFDLITWKAWVVDWG